MASNQYFMKTNKMKLKNLSLTAIAAFFLFSCGDDDGVEPANPTDPVDVVLDIPSSYSSDDYDANTVAEATVIDELSTLTAALNDAEAGAQGTTAIATIDYPSTLSSVTLSSYSELIEGWLTELVAAANSGTGFQDPGSTGTPASGEAGGLLGTRLLDENGLELEQMIQKGSFGAALYNHAVSVISSGDLTDPGTIDQLVEVHGTDANFDPEETTAAATYSRRRSNQTTESGPFYDIQTALITARAAIVATAAGGDFTSERDAALADYLLAWEKSNFATVIYYCNATKTQLQEAGDDAEALGNAMHAYAEGVGFAHGFRGVSNKQITDAQIDSILELLLAPAGETPNSYKFLSDATLLDNLDQIIEDIQAIYGFTDEEVSTFFVNDPS